MNKTLNIGSCNAADHRLAEIALFERLQAFFNINPGKMAELVAPIISREHSNTSDLVEPIKVMVLDEFEYVLKTVQQMVDGTYRYNGLVKGQRRYVPGPHTRQIRTHFRLDAKRIANDLRSKCAAENLSVSEVVQCLEYHTPTIIEWAFANVVKILRKK